MRVREKKIKAESLSENKTTQVTKKPRKRRRRNSDKTYNPKRDPANKRQKISHNHDGILAMRCDRRKEIEIDGTNHPLKTAVIVDENLLSEDAKQQFTAKIENIASNRPIHKILARSKTNSPTKISTPEKKTILYRKSHYGCISFFTNEEMTPQPNPNSQTATKTKLSNRSNFYQSKEYIAIKKFYDAIKKQKINVTQQVFKKTDAERRKNNYERVVTQNAVMAESGKSTEGSATKYAQKVLSISHVPFDWLHLVAHEILGQITQQMENLVGGTTHANTDMMFIENKLRSLAKKLAATHPEGFTLKIKAHLMQRSCSNNPDEYLQIATTIDYTIKIGDLLIPFVFNAQNPIQPHLVYKDYISALIDVLSDSVIENKDNKPTRL